MSRKGSKNVKKRKLDSSDEGEPAIKKAKKANVDKKAKAKPEAPPMTKADFMKHAKDEVGVVADIEFTAKPKKMAKSVGYNVNHHGMVKLGEDKKVAVMITMNFTAVNSKTWKEGKAEKKEKAEAEKKKRVTNPKGDVLSKSEFMALAKPLKCTVLDQEFSIEPRRAKTGSVGWGLNGNAHKFEKEVNGVKVSMVPSINITAKKSKDWEEGEDEANGDEDSEEDEDDDVAN
mmetsp:Transcript_67413/g.107065  ORF Transcript_67413/g.107065 Transcript_67413/m.107065 type:complete len:231 (+) Transcript_67413:144-836(+)